MLEKAKNLTCILAVCSAMVFLAQSSANAAAVFIDPGDTNTITLGSRFITGPELKASNETFSDDYFFSLPEQSAAPDGVETVSYSFDVSVLDTSAFQFGIANLNFTFTDTTNGDVLAMIQLTDSGGDVLSVFSSGFSIDDIWPSDIDLTLNVSGTALANGGFYNAALLGGEVMPAPLPASSLLFLSGVMGLFFLGRRRMRRDSVT